jgi:hypothetical protein
MFTVRTQTTCLNRVSREVRFELDPCHDPAGPDPSAATSSVDRAEVLRSVSCLNADSLPRAVAFNVRRRSARGDIVPSGCLHDSPDRVHNDLWLVDRHEVTGLLSDRQTSSF